MNYKIPQPSILLAIDWYISVRCKWYIYIYIYIYAGCALINDDPVYRRVYLYASIDLTELRFVHKHPYHFVLKSIALVNNLVSFILTTPYYMDTGSISNMVIKVGITLKLLDTMAQIARFMGPTWGPPGSHVGPCTLLSGGGGGGRLLLLMPKSHIMLPSDSYAVYGLLMRF